MNTRITLMIVMALGVALTAIGTTRKYAEIQMGEYPSVITNGDVVISTMKWWDSTGYKRRERATD